MTAYGDDVNYLKALCLPCLYRAQICWNTYFGVPAQDLLHHQNQGTAVAPDLTFSIDPSLKIWGKKTQTN